MVWRNSLTRTSGDLFDADEEPDDDAPADGVVQPCPLVIQIVEVGFTDQPTENPLFGGTRKQYVNLSRTEILPADSEITSENQVGRLPPIFVRVSPPQAATVRLKLTRVLHRGGFPAGSSTLSARERALSHLQWARSERTHTTDENGELLLEPGLPISALGGGEFRVQAALEGQGFVTSSNAVKVIRRVYLRPVRRYSTGWNAALGAMRGIRRQMEALGIEVKLVRAATRTDLGVREPDTLPESLMDTGRNALRSTTENVRELRPHSVAVIVGEFIHSSSGSIAPQQFRADPPRDASGELPDLVTVTLANGGATYIVVPLDDGTQLVSATLSSSTHTADIDPVLVMGLDGFSREVIVDISTVRDAFPAPAAVRLTLRVKAIRSWAVGWAYNQHPVIYLNMRTPNTGNLLSATKAEALMIHELAHKLHVTAPEDTGQPDKQAHHYPSFNNSGVKHTGPHCSTGVPPGTDLWLPAAQAASTCTMWGYLKDTAAFCTECKITLRKVDLGAGF